MKATSVPGSFTFKTVLSSRSDLHTCKFAVEKCCSKKFDLFLDVFQLYNRKKMELVQHSTARKINLKIYKVCFGFLLLTKIYDIFKLLIQK